MSLEPQPITIADLLTTITECERRVQARALLEAVPDGALEGVINKLRAELACQPGVAQA